ncbi:MAG: LPS assembly lipoprotein LptE [Gemmatimonadota bacterium]
MRPGTRRSRRLAAAATACLAGFLVSACYGFQGGGGFPPNVRTLYIEVFDLDRSVSQVELPRELREEMLDRLPGALGVRIAAEDQADAIVRGRIQRYEDGTQTYSPSAAGQTVDVAENRTVLGVQIEIVDISRNVILWEDGGVTGEGVWQRESESAEDGRRAAIEVIVQRIIDGAQSQW